MIDPEMALKEIARNVKKIRKSRDITISKLAEISGLSRALLSQIETGHRNVSMLSFLKIANALEVTFDELLSSPEKFIERLEVEVLRDDINELVHRLEVIERKELTK